MKRISLFLLVLSVVVISAKGVSAYLYTSDYGGIKLTEDYNNPGTYWYYDLTRFSDMTYDEQIAEISSISIPGYTGTWNLANQAQMDALMASYVTATFDLEGHFTPTYIDIDWTGGSPGPYDPGSSGLVNIAYSGRSGAPAGSDYHYEYYADYFLLIQNGQVQVPITGVPPNLYLTSPLHKDSDGTGGGAWVVSTDLTVVPIPPSLLLMASGLIGLVGFKRKFRR